MGDIADIGVVYRITCLVNGRVYVGSSSDFAARRRGHLHQLRKGTHHSIHLQRAFRKYGEAAIVFDILESGIPVEDLLVRETFHIINLQPAFNGSMVSATRRGSKQSDACKAKVSAANSGRKLSKRQLRQRHLSLLGNKRGLGNKNRRKVTPEIKADIDRLVAEGLGSYRIARAVGLSKKTIINVRHGRFVYA